MKAALLILITTLVVNIGLSAQDTIFICNPWDTELSGHPCSNHFSLPFDPGDPIPFHIDTLLENNIWQVGNTNKFASDLGWRPNFLITDTLNAYPINNYSTLEFNFVGQFMYEFFFNFIHMYDTGEGKDGGRIEIFNFSEKLWQDLNDYPNLEYFLNGYSTNDSISSFGDGPGFSGHLDSWKEVKISIRADLYELDTFKLRFVFASDSIDGNNSGWIIDWMFYGGMYEGIDEYGFERINSTVCPNPASSRLFIEFDNPESKLYQLTIYDNLGRQVLLDVLSDSQMEINLETCQPGIYYYQLLNDDERKGSWGKFIVKQ